VLNSILGRARLKRKRVQFVAHASPQRLIDHLVLLHAGLALKRGGDDVRGIVVSVAAQVLPPIFSLVKENAF